MKLFGNYRGKRNLLKSSKEHTSNNEFDKALQDLETAVRLYHSENDPQILLAFAYTTLKKAEVYRVKESEDYNPNEYRNLLIQAKKYAEQAIIANPNFAKAYKLLGKMYFTLAKMHQETSTKLELPNSEKALEAAIKLYGESTEYFIKARANTSRARRRARKKLNVSAEKAKSKMSNLNPIDSEKLDTIISAETSRLEKIIDHGSAIFKAQKLNPSQS